MDMSLHENSGAKKSANGGRSANKKQKKPQRGMSMEELERLREQATPLSQMSFNPYSITFTTFCTSVPSVGVSLFRPSPTPGMLFHGHMDPCVIGSSNVVYGSEDTKVLSSVPVYTKCASVGCSHKKKRINGRRNVCSYNTFAEIIDSGKASGRSSPQINESPLTEFEFFPEKGGESAVGEGSSLAAISTGNEEGYVSTVDLSLKLSC